MNNKGDIFNLLFVLIIVFIAAIVGLITLSLSNKVTHTYEQLNLFPENSTAALANQEVQDASVPATDYMIFFLFLGSVIGCIVGAVRTNFSPTIIFFFILIWIMSIFIASGFVNIYQGFAQDQTLAETANQLTLTNLVFSRYTPMVIAVIGTIIMIVMWGKSGSDIIT